MMYNADKESTALDVKCMVVLLPAADIPLLVIESMGSAACGTIFSCW